MRKGRNVITLLVVLALLVGAYIFVSNRPGDDDDGQEEQVEISVFDSDEIVEMELESKDETLVFKRVEKKDDEGNAYSEWHLDYPHPITLDQSAIESIARAFSSLYASEVVEQSQEDADLASYGLEPPAVIARAKLRDGSQKLLYLGNPTPVGSSYYLMLEGDPRVFIVLSHHGKSLSYTLKDVRDKKLVQLKIDEISYFMMKQTDMPTIEIRRNEDQTEEEAAYNLGMWKMTKPYHEARGVDSNNFQSILDTVFTLRIKDFVDDAPEDLAVYGLDDPWAELKLRDSENTLHLYFGDDAGEGDVYFKTAHSDSVYIMDKSKLTFLETKPFELAEKFTYIVNIDAVDSIVIEARGTTYIIDITREKREEDQEEDEEMVASYQVNGREVDEEEFKKFYQSLIGILADGENDKEMEELPEIKTTFYLNKGALDKREVHVNYMAYDNDFYAVFKDGKSEFIVARSKVDKMLDSLERLIEGS